MLIHHLDDLGSPVAAPHGGMLLDPCDEACSPLMVRAPRIQREAQRREGFPGGYHAIGWNKLDVFDHDKIHNLIVHSFILLIVLYVLDQR